MCGEQAAAAEEIVSGEGSPPRVRGTGDHLFLYFPFAGITPACAGNSKKMGVKPGVPEDHPRVCGEQISRNRHGLCI